MLEPTKERQQLWIKKHLNNGVCPKNRHEYLETRSLETACYSSLQWLAESNITTLASAWRQCKRPDWLLWMLLEMHLNRMDHPKIEELLAEFQKFRSEELGFDMQEIFLRHTHIGKLKRLEQYLRWGDTTKATDRKLCTAIRRVWGNPWKLKKGKTK